MRVLGVGMIFWFLLGHVDIQTQTGHEDGADDNWRLYSFPINEIPQLSRISYFRELQSYLVEINSQF